MLAAAQGKKIRPLSGEGFLGVPVTNLKGLVTDSWSSDILAVLLGAIDWAAGVSGVVAGEG